MNLFGKQLLIAFAILFLAEVAAYFLLDREGIAFSVLIQPQGLLEETEGFQNVGYDEADPLLGWGMSQGRLNELGYPVEHAMPVLISDDSCGGDVLRILITGGSTSDMAFSRENWPIGLAGILRDSGVCAKLYVAAVGGYSSGQEVLKLLRDGLQVNPDIHISYSGANEAYSPSFVSQYEMKVFDRIMESRSTILFPNLTYLIRRRLGMVSGLKVHHSTPMDVATFWMDNMKTMHSLAEQRGYRFIGILQPVLGVGKVDQPEEMDEWWDMIAEYRAFYPTAMEHAAQQPYLLDMTAIFDTVEGPVYVDDCHLHPDMQPIVAHEMLKLIMQATESADTVAVD